MRNNISRLFLVTFCGIFHVHSCLAQQKIKFEQLPKEIRERIEQAQNACRELIPEITLNEMQGIKILDLEGDGSKDIVVDHEELCSDHIPGGNCSNRGCDLAIYKEQSNGRWRKIFDEHLHSKKLVIDWETMRLKLMIISIHAGDPRCQPDPDEEYSSGKSCDLTVTYKNKKWDWELID